MSTERMLVAVEPGWVAAVDAPPVRILLYADGTRRVSHECKGWVDGLDGTVIRKVCAPALHPTGHVVVCEDPLTISPSILCPDCGLHGFIRAGRWVE